MDCCRRTASSPGFSVAKRGVLVGEILSPYSVFATRSFPPSICISVDIIYIVASVMAVVLAPLGDPGISLTLAS